MVTKTALEQPESDFATAARATSVIWAGLFALGIGFGVFVSAHGFAWWLAPLISATIFAGSLEFILIGMLVVAAPLAAIATTAFVVNSRHLFYGLSFPLERVRGRLAKTYSVWALTDEAYALLSTKDPSTLSSGRILWTQLGLHSSWAFGALVGGVAGSTVLSNVRGLDFILTALFIVLTMDAYRERPDWRTLSLAAGCALIAAVLAPQALLLVAMGLFAAVLITRSTISGRFGHVH